MHRHFDDEISHLMELLLRMGAEAEDAVAKSIRGLEERDAALAEAVIARDDEADQLTEQSLREHLTYMLEDARNSSPMIRRTFVAKYFERIAAGATNICELVVWLVEGNVVKHAGV